MDFLLAALDKAAAGSFTVECHALGGDVAGKCRAMERAT
jgi:hypothetical protein